MLGVYNRLDVCDERLRAVASHIHDWLLRCPVTHRQVSKPPATSQPADPLELAE